jgi:YbbR domain-containing protein
VQPKEILLTGDQQALEGLTEIKTATVKIDNLNASATIPITLDLPEGIRLVNANEKIDAMIDIQKIVTREIEISNMEFRNLSTGYFVDNSTARSVRVTVRGPENLVNNIEEGIDLYVDLSGAQEGKASYLVRWNKAPLLEVLQLAPQYIELDIKKGE